MAEKLYNAAGSRARSGTDGPALVVQDATVRIGGITAVQDVSLTVERGQIFTLLGPSGCGKSTLLRAIAGYRLPDSGAILLDGQDVTGLRPQQRHVGMVFQNYALFPHMTVAENVGFSLRQRRIQRTRREARIGEMLDLVRLGGLEKRYPSQLSGGQQQRVTLARALAFEPRILLLDEPFSALDRYLQEEMQSELKRVQRELNVTTVFVTHDQDEALGLSDRIGVMRAGHLEQVGAPQEIYERPCSRFVGGFVGKMRIHRASVIVRNGATVTVQVADVARPLVCHLGHLDAGDAPLVVGLRPENACVVDPKEERNGCPVFEATVRHARYQGAHLFVEAETAGGEVLSAIDPNRASEVGQTVRLTWRERGAVAFRSDDP